MSRNVAKPADLPMKDEGLAKFLGYHIKRAGAVVQADMQRAIEPLGLKMMSFTALAVVIDNPNISQTRLAQHLNIERSGVVPLIDGLEKEDLVGRHRVEGDRRSYALRATDKGQKLWREAEQAVIEHEAAIFDGVPADTLSEVKSFLYKVWHKS